MTTLRWPRRRFDGVWPVTIVVVAALGLGPLFVWALVIENWVAVALVSLLALSPILLRWPMMGFVAYAFFIPFDSVAIVADTGGATLTKLLGVVAAGVLVAAGIVERRFVRPPIVALWVVLFFLWAVATLAWALDSEMSLARIPTFANLVAMYLVAVSFRVSEKELTAVGVMTVIGGVLAAGIGMVLGFAENPDQVARRTLAVAGREANPNAVAHSLLLPLGIALAMFIAVRRTVIRVITVGGIAVIAAGIFLTMSRSSLVAVGLMICLLLYRLGARWQILPAVGTLSALLPMLPARFFDRIGRVFTGEDATGSGRTEIWSVGLRALDRFGLFGAGPFNFPAVYRMEMPGGISYGSHSAFVGTLVELGIIGLLLLLAVFVGHVLTARPTTDEEPSFATFKAAIEAACLGFLLIAVFSDAITRKPFWMAWILAVWVSQGHRAAKPTTSTQRPSTEMRVLKPADRG
jgi:O-antigen ligase